VDIQAIAYDVNGTLVDIVTDDGADEVFRAAGHALTYQGIDLRRHHVRDLYFGYMKQQQAASDEEYPEYDAVAIWRRIVDENATAFTRSMPPGKLEQLPSFLAELTRGVSRRRLRLFPHVRKTLDILKERFPLAIVTDAQSAWARGELHKVGILGYFGSVVVSGDHGFRKPDHRLFDFALKELGVEPAQTIYVGNDMHRDIYGAREAGLRTVMFDSAQGTKSYLDCVPDFTITDHRELIKIIDLA
jgi:putative hydrolase of the HAD superfamily